MLKLDPQGLRARKRRLFGTLLAVFLGVAFLSGTLVLATRCAPTSTTSSPTPTPAPTSSSAATEASDEPDARRAPIDAARSSSACGRSTASPPPSPSIEGFGQILDRDGDAIGGNGPPRCRQLDRATATSTRSRLAEGRAPRALDEVVIDRGSANDAGLDVGDRTTVLDPAAGRACGSPASPRFGGADGFGGSSFAGFTLRPAPSATSRSGPTPSRTSSCERPRAFRRSELVARIRPTLPGGVEALAGAA